MSATAQQVLTEAPQTPPVVPPVSYCGWCQLNHPLAKDGTTSTGMCLDCLEKMRAVYATRRAD